MVNMEKLCARLEGRGYSVRRFADARAAADYLDSQIDGQTVAIGGSVTVQEMGLYPRLSAHNQVIWHWEGGSVQKAMDTQVYISSVNGLAETGEIINIDGNGNRAASTLFGHETVYLVVGSNKLAPDYESALWRARNIAAPKNAQRLNRKTPCAVKGDRCYDCSSPDRICRALVVLWGKPNTVKKMEILLVDEALGY